MKSLGMTPNGQVQVLLLKFDLKDPIQLYSDEHSNNLMFQRHFESNKAGTKQAIRKRKRRANFGEKTPSSFSFCFISFDFFFLF